MPGKALSKACQDSPYLLSGTGVEIARRLGYTTKHVSEVFHDKAPISIEMALRLEYVLQLPARHWIDLQNSHDLRAARERLVEKEREEQAEGLHVAHPSGGA